MSALPLDRRDSNKYIHALESQFGGKLRNARDMSVFFTTRPDSEESASLLLSFLEEYKLLVDELIFIPSNSSSLDTELTIGHYQIWQDLTGEHLVTGTGVGKISGSSSYIVPSGAEVTVNQNGSLTAPSEETFVVLQEGAAFIAWALIDEESNVVYFLPHTGKAWYGVLTAPAEDGNNPDNIRVILLMADGTFHTQRLGAQVNENFVFFTHLYNDSSGGSSEVYFTGKELEYVPDGLPTNTYVAPVFTYVPD